MAALAGGWSRSQADEATERFDRLFLAEYPKVTAIAYRVLGDAHGAEDVAQEVFCSFYGRHDPTAPYAAAWLHRAAAHTALNVIRSRRRRQRRETEEARLSGRAEADSSLDPQQAVVQAERSQEVRAALGRLSSRSASALALRYSGLSYAEVAQALGVRADHVGTLLRRAEAALRKEMTRAAPQ